MFWTVLGEVLPAGLGAAVSPMMIVATTILATLKGGVRKVFTFGLGELVALGGVSVAAVFVAHGAQVASEPSRSTGGSALRLILGLLLWYLAWKTFRDRPTQGEEPSAVKRLNALDGMSSGKVFSLGFGMGFLNLKNLPLAVSVATAVTQTGAGTTLSVIGMLIFAALGCSLVVAPAVIVLAAPERSERVLSRLRKFMVENNTAIMMVLYLLLGASLIGKTLGPLLG